MDGAIANRSLELLDNMDTSQPFFLAVGFIRPHMPFVAPKNIGTYMTQMKLS